MDKKTIKDQLTKRFLSEESTPGISMNNKIKKENGKINKTGVTDVAKDSLKYNKSLKQDKDTYKMGLNKINYNSDYQETYHNEMEIMNGQEMLQYDSLPNKEFTKRAEEAIVGSARMGNDPNWANVVDKQMGFQGPDFNKNLVKRIKASAKKRSEDTPTLNLRGRDIQADIEDTGHRPYAIEENKTIDNNNKKPQIKESMKRLKFKTEFKGLGNALKLIPESYKVDKKVFEMTDGNESYKIRWEGTVNEGKAIVLKAADKYLVNEDIDKMKKLFNYKSQETLGLVKGKARLDENKIFSDMLSKSKSLMTESDDIDSVDAPEGDASSAVSQAPEAKKHISNSSAKITEKPKEGHWEDVKSGGEKMIEKVTEEPKEGHWEDNVKGQAPEAKKHIEGSTSTEKGTKAPKPKEGHWEDDVKGQASEAKKHIHLKETLMKEIEEDMMRQSMMEEDEELEDDNEETTDDSWDKPEVDSEPISEPSTSDIKKMAPPIPSDDEEDDVVVPAPKKPTKSIAKLLFSKSTGEYWIDIDGKQEKVPASLMSVASDPTKTGAEKATLIKSKIGTEKSDHRQQIKQARMASTSDDFDTFGDDEI